MVKAPEVGIPVTELEIVTLVRFANDDILSIIGIMGVPIITFLMFEAIK